MNTAQALKPAACVMRACPDAATDPAGNAGWFLERERFKRGYSLNSAREGTGIALQYLIAIERGQLSRLPAGDQALTLIGAYGHWLGFDPAPLTSHFATLLQSVPRALPAKQLQATPKLEKITKKHPSPKVQKPVARKFSNRLIIGASVTSIIGIFAVTGILLATSNAPNPNQISLTEPSLASEPTGQANPLPQPVAPPSDMILSDTADQATALQGLGELINQTIAAVDASGIGPRAEAVPLRGTMPPPEFIEQNGHRIFNSSEIDARVVLTARGQVWLQIEDASGRVIANLTLVEGDQYRVPNLPGLEVIARDGGLIGATLDGRDVGTLGAPGEILVGKPLSDAIGL